MERVQTYIRRRAAEEAACTSISTEALESGAVQELVAVVRRMVKLGFPAYKTQRLELVTILDEAEVALAKLQPPKEG